MEGAEGIAITIIAIFVAGVLMFVFPLIAMSDNVDDATKLTAQTATTDFVDNIRTTGKITEDDYNSYLQTLASTGNSYDVEIKVQVLDENYGKKVSTVQTTKIGENVYYPIYTTQVEAQLVNDGVYALKEGDIVYVSAKNTNITFSQELKNFFYKVTGSNASSIEVEDSGMVVAPANS